MSACRVDEQLEQLNDQDTSMNQSEYYDEVVTDKIKITHQITSNGKRKIKCEVVEIIQSDYGPDPTNQDQDEDGPQLESEKRSQQDEEKASELVEGSVKGSEVERKVPLLELAEERPGNIPTAGLIKMWKKNEELARQKTGSQDR